MGMNTGWIYDDGLRERERRLYERGFEVYCLFSMTNSEIRIATELNCLNESCIALPFLRMMRKKESGKRTLAQVPLLAGYVFLFVPEALSPDSLQKGKQPFRVLEREQGGGKLTGEDRRYAEWALAQGGILDVSRAVQMEDKVRIVSGPLLDLQGCITGFSKKSKNYQVEFEMMGRAVNVWLPYELIEPAGEWKG